MEVVDLLWSHVIKKKADKLSFWLNKNMAQTNRSTLLLQLKEVFMTSSNNRIESAHGNKAMAQHSQNQAKLNDLMEDLTPGKSKIRKIINIQVETVKTIELDQ